VREFSYLKNPSCYLDQTGYCFCNNNQVQIQADHRFHVCIYRQTTDHTIVNLHLIQQVKELLQDILFAISYSIHELFTCHSTLVILIRAQ